MGRRGQLRGWPLGSVTVLGGVSLLLMATVGCVSEGSDFFVSSGASGLFEATPARFIEATRELGVDHVFPTPDQPPTIFPEYKCGGASVLADLDGDGLLDLLVSVDRSICLLRNLGDLEFAERVPIQVAPDGLGPTTSAVAWRS